MKTYKNLLLLGTSHIAKQSLDEVKHAIEQHKPDIISLELDRTRFTALLQKKKQNLSIYDIRRIGIKGYFFALIGSWVERKLGEYVGIAPGSEMKQAIMLAKKNNIQIALIDQHIEITLKKLSKNISWKERWNFLVDIFKAIVLREKEIEFDLKTVPSQKIIDMMMKKVKIRYPNIYRVLIIERNQVMANNLVQVMQQNPDKKILAILGAGHIDDILILIKNNRQI